jgi:uncharacterized protein with HEPN domain
MLEHAKEAMSLVSGRTRQDLQKDRVLQLALTRLVEIIGEAASRVGDETRSRFPSIPWSMVVGMRNRLIHGYDTIDLDVLWDTATDDLPSLAGELESALNPGD